MMEHRVAVLYTVDKLRHILKIRARGGLSHNEKHTIEIAIAMLLESIGEETHGHGDVEEAN